MMMSGHAGQPTEATFWSSKRGEEIINRRFNPTNKNSISDRKEAKMSLPPATTSLKTANKHVAKIE